MQPAIKKRNDKIIRILAKKGTIGNYLYGSAKTGQGMLELKKAIMDADIKNHGDKIRPPGSEKKKRPQPAPQQFGDEEGDEQLIGDDKGEYDGP